MKALRVVGSIVAGIFALAFLVVLFFLVEDPLRAFAYRLRGETPSGMTASGVDMSNVHQLLTEIKEELADAPSSEQVEEIKAAIGELEKKLPGSEQMEKVTTALAKLETSGTTLACPESRDTEILQEIEGLNRQVHAACDPILARLDQGVKSTPVAPAEDEGDGIKYTILEFAGLLDSYDVPSCRSAKNPRECARNLVILQNASYNLNKAITGSVQAYNKWADAK